MLLFETFFAQFVLLHFVVQAPGVDTCNPGRLAFCPQKSMNMNYVKPFTGVRWHWDIGERSVCWIL